MIEQNNNNNWQIESSSIRAECATNEQKINRNFRIGNFKLYKKRQQINLYTEEKSRNEFDYAVRFLSWVAFRWKKNVQCNHFRLGKHTSTVMKRSKMAIKIH